MGEITRLQVSEKGRIYSIGIGDTIDKIESCTRYMGDEGECEKYYKISARGNLLAVFPEGKATAIFNIG